MEVFVKRQPLAATVVEQPLVTRVTSGAALSTKRVCSVAWLWLLLASVAKNWSVVVPCPSVRVSDQSPELSAVAVAVKPVAEMTALASAVPVNVSDVVLADVPEAGEVIVGAFGEVMSDVTVVDWAVDPVPLVEGVCVCAGPPPPPMNLPSGGGSSGFRTGMRGRVDVACGFSGTTGGAARGSGGGESETIGFTGSSRTMGFGRDGGGGSSLGSTPSRSSLVTVMP